MKRSKRIAILTFAGVLLFGMGTIASGVYLTWTGDNNLSNAEADVSEYVAKVNSYIRKTEKAIESLKTQVESLKETKASLEQQLADQNGHNETLQNKISELEKDIEELESQIDELNNSLKDTSDLLQNANNEIGKLTEENENLKIELENNSDEIERLNNELIKANNSAQTHEQNIQTILEGSEPLDESIFEDIDENEEEFSFDARDFTITRSSNTTLLEQTENKLYIRISYGNCLTYIMNLSNDCLEVGKKYRLSLDMDYYNTCLTVQNGSQTFSLTPTGTLDTTFTAESESLNLNFYYNCNSYLSTSKEFTIRNISLTEVK